MNARIAGHAGTPQLRQFHMVNIKELRERNRAGSIDGAMLLDSQSDQAISLIKPDGENESVRPGPGLKLQAATHDLAEATGPKQQASSVKLRETQASSGKHQAPSSKHQA